MNKILIIGQSPPNKPQQVPYDSTLLYVMLSWVNITKEQAQEMFEFEAISLINPGKHAPKIADMKAHWPDLEEKIQCADKVWLLGISAGNFFWKQPKTWSCNLQVLYTMHPSRRNYSRIMKKKEEITQQLFSFLNN